MEANGGAPNSCGFGCRVAVGLAALGSYDWTACFAITALGNSTTSGASHAGDLLTGPVEHERRRQTDGAERAKRLAGGISVDRKFANADLGVELGHGLTATVVDRERIDSKTPTSERCLQPVERRHFLPARHAPGRPQIEDDHLAVEIGEAADLPIAILEVQRSDRLRGRIRDEVPQRVR